MVPKGPTNADSLTSRLRDLRRTALGVRVRDPNTGRAGRLPAAEDPRLIRLKDSDRVVAVVGISDSKATLVDLLLGSALMSRLPKGRSIEIRSGASDAMLEEQEDGAWQTQSLDLVGAPPAETEGNGVKQRPLRYLFSRWPLPANLALLYLPDGQPPGPCFGLRPDGVLLVFRVHWDARQDKGRDPFHDEAGVIEPLRAALQEFGARDVIAVPNLASPRQPEQALQNWRDQDLTMDKLRDGVAGLAAKWGFPGLSVVPVATRAALDSPGDGDRFGIGPLRRAVGAWVEQSLGVPTKARLRDAADAVERLTAAIDSANERRRAWEARPEIDIDMDIVNLAPVVASQDLTQLAAQAIVLRDALAAAGSVRN